MPVKRHPRRSVGTLNNFNLITNVNNQTLVATYYAPKEERDINKQAIDLNKVTRAELRNMYTQNFAKERDKLTKDFGQDFFYKDGTEDVYTKSGFDKKIIDYLQNNETSGLTYRIITDNANINFLAGGKVVFGSSELYVVKVITMTNDVSIQNKFRFNPYDKDFTSFGLKVLALV